MRRWSAQPRRPETRKEGVSEVRALRVVAVVVTWNRRDMLAESLAAIAAQTSVPDEVVVVDNASDDGTTEMLRTDFPSVDVVSARTNTGGAGGFALGLQRGLSLDADAVWLMDDDTVPEPTALAELVSAHVRFGQPPPTVVASRVVWSDGRDHPMNTPRAKPGMRAVERAAAARVGCVPIRSASFVSILVDASIVSERGLPIADYFLWNDDFEFTTRLLRGRRGLFCPRSVVVHKTKAFAGTELDPGDRFFYEVRNKIWLFARSAGLNPAEKVLYAGSTVRRWTRTVARSSDRGRLLRALGRGVRAGLMTRPARTDDVLAAARFEQPAEGDDG
jgi:rhamnopyranosyl-N-acetylglucosaminyl-diphospho-decaprenol beta-1,3/1,4-galactofuranosyltransferase